MNPPDCWTAGLEYTLRHPACAPLATTLLERAAAMGKKKRFINRSDAVHFHVAGTEAAPSRSYGVSDCCGREQPCSLNADPESSNPVLPPTEVCVHEQGKSNLASQSATSNKKEAASSAAQVLEGLNERTTPG